MFKASEYFANREAVRAAEEKRKRKLPLSTEEQELLDKFSFPLKLCGCGCGDELEPRVDGEHHTVNKVEVNSDCYFASFGDELEKHPIGGLGIRRGRVMWP